MINLEVGETGEPIDIPNLGSIVEGVLLNQSESNVLGEETRSRLVTKAKETRVPPALE